MLPSTATDALSLGASRYWTGEPCRRGHVSERHAVSRICVECQAVLSKEYRQRHLGRILEREQAERTKSREHRRQYAVSRYAENKQAVRAATEKWRQANKAVDAAKAARRKAAKLRATPPWANQDRVVALYQIAADLTRETGTRHEVDHIVPLQGETVCGLHVHWNLQILTKSENSRKKNKFEVTP